jgi:hypothetical protein
MSQIRSEIQRIDDGEMRVVGDHLKVNTDYGGTGEPPNTDRGATIDILALRDKCYAVVTITIFLVEWYGRKGKRDMELKIWNGSTVTGGCERKGKGNVKVKKNGVVYSISNKRAKTKTKLKK